MVKNVRETSERRERGARTSLERIAVRGRRARLMQFVPATVRVHRIHAARLRAVPTAMLRRHTDHGPLRTDEQRLRVP